MLASHTFGSSWFLAKGMKVTSKMKLSPGIQLDVVIDQLGLSDDSPKTRMNPRDAQRGAS
jgi:hypothetical protein